MAVGGDRPQDTPAFLMGQLAAQVATLNTRIADFTTVVGKLDERLDANDRRVDRIESEVVYMKPHVSSWSRCKNKLAGAVVVLSGIGTVAGIGLSWIGGWAIKWLEGPQ